MNSPVQIWRNHKKLHKYLGKEGKIIVWTKIYVAPSGFEHQVPYLAGIIELKDGQRIPLQIVDCEEEDLKPQKKVSLVIRKVGKVRQDEVISYGLKAKPI